MVSTKMKLGIVAGVATLLLGAGVALAHAKQKGGGGGGGGGGGSQRGGGAFNPPPDDGSGLPPMFSNDGFPGGQRSEGDFSQDDFPGFSSDPSNVHETGPSGGGWVDENMNPPPNTRNDPNDPTYDPSGEPPPTNWDPMDPSTWGLGAVAVHARRIY